MIGGIVAAFLCDLQMWGGHSHLAGFGGGKPAR